MNPLLTLSPLLSVPLLSGQLVPFPLDTSLPLALPPLVFRPLPSDPLLLGLDSLSFGFLFSSDSFLLGLDFSLFVFYSNILLNGTLVLLMASLKYRFEICE